MDFRLGSAPIEPVVHVSSPLDVPVGAEGTGFFLTELVVEVELNASKGETKSNIDLRDGEGGSGW